MMRPMAHDLFEHFSKAGGHEVVKDRVDCWAEVEKHAGDDMHVLKDFMMAISPVTDEAPHEAIRMKRGPADPKNHH